MILRMEVESDATVIGKLEAIKHIHKVRALLCKVIEELDSRARLHDQSKLESPEKEIFGEFTPELAKVEYDSPEYKALLVKVKPAIDHHYAKNRHHPESHAKGIDDMNLIDIMEMLLTGKLRLIGIKTGISANRLRRIRRGSICLRS